MSDRFLSDLAEHVGHLGAVAAIAAVHLRGVIRSMGDAYPPDRAEVMRRLEEVAADLQAAADLPTPKGGGA